MGERTINQKSFKEVWEKINVPFPEEAYEATSASQRRIKEKCIKQRLDDVFGCCNYDLLIGKPMLEYGPGGQNNGCMAFYSGTKRGVKACYGCQSSKESDTSVAKMMEFRREYE